MGWPSGARNPPWVLRIKNCLRPASAGFQPMPAFCVSPNKSPLGLFQQHFFGERQAARPGPGAGSESGRSPVSASNTSLLELINLMENKMSGDPPKAIQQTVSNHESFNRRYPPFLFRKRNSLNSFHRRRRAQYSSQLRSDETRRQTPFRRQSKKAPAPAQPPCKASPRNGSPKSSTPSTASPETGWTPSSPCSTT